MLVCVCNVCRRIFNPSEVSRVTIEALPNDDIHVCGECLEEVKKLFFDNSAKDEEDQNGE